jgi:F-type H+-transporting ATPase subunit delta
MANLSSIARPYALAAFQYAREKKQLSAWKSFMGSAADVARDKTVVKLLGNPQVSSMKMYDLFKDVLKSQLDTERTNFLLLVAQNKRLAVLPEIADLFNELYANDEKISNVRVITAVPMQDDYRAKLTASLSKRIHRDVTLHSEVDPTIVGGAIIHIADRVIDGSIRGKLSRLLQNLIA